MDTHGRVAYWIIHPVLIRGEETNICSNKSGVHLYVEGKVVNTCVHKYLLLTRINNVISKFMSYGWLKATKITMLVTPPTFIFPYVCMEYCIISGLLIPIFWVMLSGIDWITTTLHHRWVLPVNYPVFTVVMVIYHYVDRIWRILVIPIFLYKIYDNK